MNAGDGGYNSPYHTIQNDSFAEPPDKQARCCGFTRVYYFVVGLLVVSGWSVLAGLVGWWLRVCVFLMLHRD